MDPGEPIRPTAPVGQPPAEVEVDHPGDWIGPYKILQLLGEGGFGIVWLAERRDAISQRVALKVLKAGMDSRAVVARFEQERQALAVMDHPNVAKVFDAGTTARGLPFFVMEHVAGESITAYCDRHKLPLRERLQLFIPVCAAVQHAHHKGLIHRDLKPSNILVSVHDGLAVPKVIDFGVAKAISHTLTEKTIFTAHGVLVGTPEYMSPEQAEMGATDIDTRTDVYSLGVILYQLLSGMLPFDSQTLRSKGYAEIRRIIREEDPPKPSTRLSAMASAPLTSKGAAAGKSREHEIIAEALRRLETGSPTQSREHAQWIAKQRQIPLPDLMRALRRELDWIPLKALRKDRTERYRTPEDLADDIRRYLRGEALEAGPESAAYRARKFVRRHRGPVTAGAAVFAALAAGLAGTLWQWREARRESERADERARAAIAAEKAAQEQRKAAQEERDIAGAVTDFLQEMLTGVDPRVRAGGIDVRVVDVLETAAGALAAAEAAGGATDADRHIRATLHRVIGSTYTAIGRSESAESHVRQAVADERQLAGSVGSERLALALLDYADWCGEAGVGESGIAAATEALALFRRLHAGDHPQVAFALQRLSYLESRAGRYDAGERRALEALEMRQRLAPAGDRDTLVALNELALAQRGLGRPAEAEETWKKAVERFEPLLGPRDVYVVVCKSNLAVALNERGAIDEAEPLLWAVRPINIETLGAAHPDSARNTLLLADIRRRRKQFDEAEPLFAEALESFEQSLGANAAEVGDTLRLWGLLRRDQRQFTQARDLLRRAVGVLPGDPVTRSFFAWACKNDGNLPAAIEEIGRAVDLERAEPSRNRARFAKALFDQGCFLSEAGRHGEAEGPFAEALAIQRDILEPTDPALGNTLIFAAENLMGQEKPAEAEALFRECLQTRLTMQGIDRWRVGSARAGVGWAAAHQGRFDEADELLKLAHEEISGDPKATAAALAKCKARLADLYDRWGRPDEAARWRAP